MPSNVSMRALLLQTNCLVESWCWLKGFAASGNKNASTCFSLSLSRSFLKSETCRYRLWNIEQQDCLNSANGILGSTFYFILGVFTFVFEGSFFFGQFGEIQPNCHFQPEYDLFSFIFSGLRFPLFRGLHLHVVGYSFSVLRVFVFMFRVICFHFWGLRFCVRRSSSSYFRALVFVFKGFRSSFSGSSLSTQPIYRCWYKKHFSFSFPFERNTVELRYFKPSGVAQNSLKYRKFEIANSKWLKGKSKGNGF